MELTATERTGNFPAYFGGVHECSEGHLLGLVEDSEKTGDCPTCKRERAHGRAERSGNYSAVTTRFDRI